MLCADERRARATEWAKVVYFCFSFFFTFVSSLLRNSIFSSSLFSLFRWICIHSVSAQQHNMKKCFKCPVNRLLLTITSYSFAYQKSQQLWNHSSSSTSFLLSFFLLLINYRDLDNFSSSFENFLSIFFLLIIRWMLFTLFYAHLMDRLLELKINFHRFH